MSSSVSIVTVCLNDLQGLKKTALSLENQTCRDFEWIVVDGGSEDGTREYLQDNPLVNRFVSEPDSGIYDAMNKGINLVGKEYKLSLNTKNFLCIRRYGCRYG